LPFENKPSGVYTKSAKVFEEEDMKGTLEPKVTGRAAIHVQICKYEKTQQPPDSLEHGKFTTRNC
jgi:hypothetical protein